MNEPIDSIKAYIQRFFSDELQRDETPAGAMERRQLQKWMLEWALNQPQHWYHQE